MAVWRSDDAERLSVLVERHQSSHHPKSIRRTTMIWSCGEHFFGAPCMGYMTVGRGQDQRMVQIAGRRC